LNGVRGHKIWDWATKLISQLVLCPFIRDDRSQVHSVTDFMIDLLADEIDEAIRTQASGRAGCCQFKKNHTHNLK
jgi:hypothetical protein